MITAPGSTEVSRDTCEAVMPTWLRSVAVVIASLILATLLTFPLQHIATHSVALFFMAAVIVAARFAGPYTSVAGALLSVLIFDWVLRPASLSS